MLLNKPNDLATTLVMKPTDIRDYFMPIKLCMYHGIIDHANFNSKTDFTNSGKYSNYIESIIDIPSTGKLFTGKWLDFNSDYEIVQKYIPRYKPYFYGTSTTQLFDDIEASGTGMPANHVMYWGISLSGGNNVFSLYTYDPATAQFTLVGATASYNSTGTKTVATGGTTVAFVDINQVPVPTIAVSLSNYILFSDNDNAITVYNKFSTLCHYANQKTHHIRSMDFQVSMTRESLTSMTQGIAGAISTNRENIRSASRELGGFVGQVSQASGNARQILNGITSAYFRNSVEKASGAADIINAARKQIEDLKSTRVSVTNKFRIEKPYGSDLVSFDSRGECKMCFLDDDGNARQNKMHYQIYVSFESDDEVEITVATFFENNEVLGDEDYAYITGKIEMLFETRT